MKNFFRKVAFGIGPKEEVPLDPLNWALNQVNDCLLYTSDAADE